MDQAIVSGRKFYPQLTAKQESYCLSILKHTTHQKVAQASGHSASNSTYFVNEICRRLGIKGGKSGIVKKLYDTGIVYRTHENRLKFISLKFVETMLDGDAISGAK